MSIPYIKLTNDGWFEIEGINVNLPMDTFKTDLQVKIDNELKNIREDFDMEEVPLDFIILRKSFENCNKYKT